MICPSGVVVSRPWWTGRPVITPAMLWSPKMVPHLEKGMLVVMMRLLFSEALVPKP